MNDPNAPVLIDQEGGRVARLKPPHWKARPPAARFGELYATRSRSRARSGLSERAADRARLAELGINVDCVPVLDVPVEGADAVIGDRAFAAIRRSIIDLGRAVIEGMIEGGVLPVMKHIPGHGRADCRHAISRCRASRPTRRN